MTNRQPKDWRDLQNLVAKYFNESGYLAFTPYKIETARGQVEIDVFVLAEQELGRTILCECKFWETKILQEKAHAFRMVVSDSGASLGIIISKSGFQSGTIKAVEKTNIELKTWDEFLAMVYDKWLTSSLTALKRKRAPLGVYMDPLDVSIEELSEENKEKYLQLIKRYMPINIAIFEITKKNFIEKEKILCGTNEFDNAEEYIEYLSDQTEKALECFENIFEEINIPEYKFDFPDSYSLFNL